MDNWIRLASAIYYTGVGAVLVGTAVRFFYRFIKGYDQDREFLEELKEVHLRNIYATLQQIARQLDIELEIKTPGL